MTPFRHRVPDAPGPPDPVRRAGRTLCRTFRVVRHRAALSFPIGDFLTGPRYLSSQARVSRTSSFGGTAGGQHILYVDDDESLVFLVDRLLKRHGFRVSGFTDQVAALDALRADSALFDLVVTDYNMPGMSGLDVAREVRAIRADQPVAVASGFVDEALRAQACAAGVRELVFKADVAEDLCNAFARLARTVGGRPIA